MRPYHFLRFKLLSFVLFFSDSGNKRNQSDNFNLLLQDTTGKRACACVFALDVVGAAFTKPELVSRSLVPVHLHCRYVRYIGVGAHHQFDTYKKTAHTQTKRTEP